MEEKTVLQPVGCAPKQSFVLKPLVGLLPEGKPVKAPPIWRNYWSEGELCVLAGDTGAGKSLLTIALAKEIAKGCEEIAPRKVLYIGHDYDTRGFAERYGESDAEADSNFFFALFNQGEYGIYKKYDEVREWLLQGLVTLLDQTGAKLLIFDQPDRLNLSNAQWIDFLNVVEKLRRERGLSILLVVSTRTRNTGRAVELYHAYKHQLTTTFADTVVAVCRSQRLPQYRYIKHLKCKNRMPAITGNVDVFTIDETEDNYLQIVCEEVQREEKLLPRSKAQERLDKVMTAEGLRREGVSFRKIGELFDMPESTIRSWVSGITVEVREDEKPARPVFSWSREINSPPNIGGVPQSGEGVLVEPDYTTPSLRDTPPTLGGELNSPQLNSPVPTASVGPPPQEGDFQAEQEHVIKLLPEGFKTGDIKLNVKVVSS